MGPGYNNVSPDERACSMTGAIAGQNYVDGERYLNTTFEYTHSHLWR
jgi:ATP-binding cassette subfamily G (WHITE) protein 2 (PDR)